MVAIGRLHHGVFDTRDPMRDATFWSRLLGLPITFRSDDWVVVSEAPDQSGLAFQLAPDHQPPAWPDPARSQQFHWDVMVDDVPSAERAVEDLGGRRLTSAEGSVWADPTGHPFCLIPRPGWAAPIADP